MATTEQDSGAVGAIEVEVVYGIAGARVLRQQLGPHCTLRQAIEQSGILALYPEIDLNRNKVGVFGKARALTEPARAGDRIEIYRPLPVDPKTARRRRAGQ